MRLGDVLDHVLQHAHRALVQVVKRDVLIHDFAINPVDVHRARRPA
jgi:indole-3-glycerol phosphate synthase